jgi:hypothetical protein
MNSADVRRTIAGLPRASLWLGLDSFGMTTMLMAQKTLELPWYRVSSLGVERPESGVYRGELSRPVGHPPHQHSEGHARKPFSPNARRGIPCADATRQKNSSSYLANHFGRTPKPGPYPYPGQGGHRPRIERA